MRRELRACERCGSHISHLQPNLGPHSSPVPRSCGRSFIAGARNNILGMVGFVREGRKSGNRFNERINAEKVLMAKVAAKRAAKEAAAKQGK